MKIAATDCRATAGVYMIRRQCTIICSHAFAMFASLCYVLLDCLRVESYTITHNLVTCILLVLHNHLLQIFCSLSVYDERATVVLFIF
jgi:hypothetical protein